MRRAIILTGIGIAVILAIIAFMQYNLRKEKSASPEDYVIFGRGNLTVTLFYNRPSKKNREIFGGLVPYGEVWRTGANEATTFETNRDLIIEGKTLRRGKYSLWTIPRPDTWTIIFNSEHGQWGINSKGEPNRDPARDVLTVDVPAMTQDRVIEQFTVTFESVGDDVEMVLMWDKTLVAVPFSYQR
ncbi:MAG: DUF2911 domain-containing protein [Cyclobacteriaceae bacterium]|jgi:hypothetical protein|nr:DUF2911 domain-containing protein [Cyclobacteriaceae bacterium]